MAATADDPVTTVGASGDLARHGLAGSLEMLSRLELRSWSVAVAATRGPLLKRHMQDGTIAGAVVGIVAALGLVILCVYPFVVRRFRNPDDLPFDPEAAIAEAAPGASAVVMGPHRRLSSNDSFTRSGDLSRGNLGERGSNEMKRGSSQDGNGFAHPRGAYGHPPSSSSADGDAIPGEYRVQAAPFPLLGCYDGEFAPRISQDDQPGVLKGTSADYYSPYIPSEAFGMVTEPEPTLETLPVPASSYGTSLRQDLMYIFHRKSRKDQTWSSTTPPTTAGEPFSRSGVLYDGATPAQPIITDGDHVESPISLSMPPPPASHAHRTPISPPASGTPEATAKTPPESPFRPHQQINKSACPPVHAAPGTVNPMDIMPASTESEVWHRTEHRLFAASHAISPSNSATIPLPGFANGPIMPSPSPSPSLSPIPPETQTQPTFTVQSPDTGPYVDFAIKQEPVKFDHAAMPGLTSQEHDNLVAAPDGRHPSSASDRSSAPPRHVFADGSCQNTPSTQVDSLSPESAESSDFRHSASPQSGLGAHSPRIGGLRCEEPGCNQVFDQPHKLKHHQRYHSKDHKCHYPGCGKGFGTKTHLQRHMNDRHEKKKKFHCSVPACDYSRTGGKAFPRKDNWKRHMTKIHDMDRKQLPEPVEVDMEMGGM